MKSRDALAEEVGLLINRTALFILISLSQAFALWLSFWMHFENWTLAHTVLYVANVWPLSLDVFASVVGMAVAWVGIANTAIIYLMLGRWWKRRADVLHRRGSRFVDEREER